MKPEQEIFELIEGYLAGQLTEDELNRVEGLLEKDASFQKAVDQRRLVNEALFIAGLDQLKSTIKKDVEEIPYKKNGLLRKIAVGVGLLSMSLTTIFFMKNNGEDRTDPPQINTTVPTKEIKEKGAPVSVIETNHTKPNPVSSLPDSTLPQNDEGLNDEVKTPQNKVTPTIDTSLNGLELNKSNSDTSFETTSPQTLIDTNEVEPITSDVKCDASFELLSTPTCKEESVGTIVITENKGITFKAKLLPDDIISHNGLFEQLNEGTYQIELSYFDTQCVDTVQLKVDLKWCPLNSNYSFNPSFGEVWNIKYDAEQEGIFQIYNSRGTLIFEGEFGNDEGSWDGSAVNGEETPVGNYIGIIKYNGGQQEKVELTIIR